MKKFFIPILLLFIVLSQGTMAQLYTNGGVLPHSEPAGFLGIGTNVPTQELTIKADNPFIRFESNAGGSQGLSFTSAEGNGGISHYQGNMSLNFKEGYLKMLGKEGMKFYVKDPNSFSLGGPTLLSDLPLVITPKGRVGIGFSHIYSSIGGSTGEFDDDLMPGNHKLYVSGSMIAEKVVVKLQANWMDIVFEPEYELTPLSEVEKFIEENKHLPGVPSAKELKEKGLDVEEMQTIQMQKIEELTLYLIDMKKENEILKKKLQELETKINQKTHE